MVLSAIRFVAACVAKGSAVISVWLRRVGIARALCCQSMVGSGCAGGGGGGGGRLGSAAVAASKFQKLLQPRRDAPEALAVRRPAFGVCMKMFDKWTALRQGCCEV